MFAMDPGELDGDGKVGDERSLLSPKLDTMADTRVSTMRRADASLQERFLGTGRTSTTLLQRSNSSTERSQRSSLQPSGLSSPTTRSRQNSAFIRTQTSPSSPRTDLLARPHSPHPRSPRALPPEVSLPESGRASPIFRSAAGYSTLQRGGTYLKKGKLPILKKGSLLFLLLLFVWFTFDWWYLSRFQSPSHRFANMSTTIQVNCLFSLGPFILHQRFLCIRYLPSLVSLLCRSRLLCIQLRACTAIGKR